MELTSNQKDLLEKFSKFIESESRVLMIQGYAGTGKTFMIGALAKQLAELQRSVSLLAPTGRAARVLQEKTGRLASTIHRAIYDLDQVTVREDDPGLFKYVFKTKESASDNLNITYFVDEASLISDHHNETEFLQFGSGKLLSDLVQFLRLESPESRAKLVLVGDPAQLTPVGMDCSPALDPS
jgi:ATP-dependent exoDNAse (exonuclease V) alpha subunit